MSFFRFFERKSAPVWPKPVPPLPPPSRNVGVARQLLVQIEFWERKGEPDLVAGLWRMLESKAEEAAVKHEKIANAKVLGGGAVEVPASDSNTPVKSRGLW